MFSDLSSSCLFHPSQEKLIGESRFVQNNPPTFIPQESKIVDHVVAALDPYSEANGGALKIEAHTYVEGRPNLMVQYNAAAAEKGTVAIVGSHLDVVPANPETWTVDPFKLTVEGDKLYGVRKFHVSVSRDSICSRLSLESYDAHCRTSSAARPTASATWR
eukprot:SAG11_NODE_1348_length_5137_cov_3.785232_7_plen_161_part_00